MRRRPQTFAVGHDPGDAQTACRFADRTADPVFAALNALNPDRGQRRSRRVSWSLRRTSRHWEGANVGAGVPAGARGL